VSILETLCANLHRCSVDHLTASIGGGSFGPTECSEITNEIRKLQDAAKASTELLATLRWVRLHIESRDRLFGERLFTADEVRRISAAIDAAERI